MAVDNEQEVQHPGNNPDAPERGMYLEKSKWPGDPEIEMDEEPIDLLKPDSQLHDKVLDYLLRRLNYSEEKMSHFYHRWRVMEQRTQAYIDLPEWEQEWKRMNEKGKKPSPVSIVVPYQFSTISTIVTYLLHTFTGRKPMFNVGSYKDETAHSSRMMETVLQYQSDHTRLIKELFEFLQSSQQYGVGILRTLWVVDERMRTVTTATTEGYMKRKEKKVVYEGNEVECVDPFMAFPDPRVPMCECNKRGEFFFWRMFEGRHILKRDEASGVYKFVDNASKSLPRNYGGDSARAAMAGGDSTPGVRPEDSHRTQSETMQVDQGTVEIIPAELGLGDEEKPQKWLFTILNKSQIVQAVPLDADHDMHPVAITEPYSLGQSFGSPGISDYLGPLQDMISWLINSHQDNVRKVLNDMIIVDPSMVEMQDLRDPKPGKLIRLKKAAQGRDVRTIMQQMNVQDVTKGHIQDAELFMRLGQQLSAVTENVLGMQAEGGRKTATEVRTSTEAAASRLAAQARIISAQGLVDLTEQMAVNTQQYMTEDFFLQVVGREGKENPIHVTPDQVSGDFYFPVHDGTLPLDKTALFDIWSNLFTTALKDQELRKEYSMSKMFEHVAELGGAQNIEAMKLKTMGEQDIQEQQERGNIVSMEDAQQAFGDQAPGAVPDGGGFQPTGSARFG